jgi:hypothetical protein
LCNKFVLNEGFKKTVTVGYLLLEYRKFDQDRNVNETLSYFNLSNNLKQYNFVVVFGTKYRINDFILTSTDEDMPSFGCIQLILVEESDVIFIYRKCVTVLFDEHYHSYLINNDVRMNGFGCINQEMLPYKSPVLCSIVGNKSFLTLYKNTYIYLLLINLVKFYVYFCFLTYLPSNQLSLHTNFV